MKIWIGHKKEEKERLLGFGIHPATICLNNEIYFTGIPVSETLDSLGLRLPNCKEARYLSEILRLQGGGDNLRVWAKDTGDGFEQTFSSYKAMGKEDYDILRSNGHARLVLIERED